MCDCPTAPFAWYLLARIGSSWRGCFAYIKDVRTDKQEVFTRVNYVKRIRWSDTHRAIIIENSGCFDEQCASLDCRYGTRRELRVFAAFEEAVLASLPHFKRLWDSDGDHAIFNRVFGFVELDQI
jgi:hypothetical protein